MCSSDLARRGRDLVQQILSFSRRQPVQRKAILLDTVVDEAVRLLRSTLPARVSIHVQCAPGGPMVQADATQMEQVIINLLANGRDAIEAARIAGADHTAGHITVAVTAEAGRQILIAVEDDGVGLSAQVASRLFDPFFTTKHASNGMGLGLSISAGIVQAMGGRMEAMPRPAGGARLVVLLPARPAREDIQLAKHVAE